MSKYAILKGKELVKCGLLEWSKWIETHRDRKIVGRTIIGDVLVSTVFLGLNHGWNGDELWFETLIFEGPDDGWMDRYKTYQQAIDGHLNTVKKVIEGKSLRDSE